MDTLLYVGKVPKNKLYRERKAWRYLPGIFESLYYYSDLWITVYFMGVMGWTETTTVWTQPGRGQFQRGLLVVNSYEFQGLNTHLWSRGQQLTDNRNNSNVGTLSRNDMGAPGLTILTRHFWNLRNKSSQQPVESFTEHVPLDEAVLHWRWTHCCTSERFRKTSYTERERPDDTYQASLNHFTITVTYELQSILWVSWVELRLPQCEHSQAADNSNVAYSW